MWCDDFDMDLYKVIPAAKEILAPVAAVELVTHGSLTDGKLNHPACWNHQVGMIAFFGFDQPGKPDAYWTDEPIVHCTFEEAIRDCWPHHYAIVLSDRVIWNSQSFRNRFMALMYHIRGWRKLSEQAVEHCQAKVAESLRAAVASFEVERQRYELLRKQVE